MPKNLLQLAIETTGVSGSIAILSANEVLNHHQLPSDQRTASSLAPAVDNAIKWCGEQNLKLDFVSVATGPGSFTGLRIGVTTAKTLCYATKLPLVAVDSLAAIAATVFANRSEIESLIVGVNAFRGQVFKGEYHRNVLMDGELMPDESAVKLVDTPQWQSILKSINDENKWCTGDAKVFKTIQPTNFVSRTIPDAVGVGLLGMQAAEKQHWCEPITLVPRYIKKSAAEENSAEEKSAKENSAKENSVKENTVQ